MPAAVPEHDSVEVPEIETLVGLTLQTRLEELVETDSATVPVNPPTGVTVIVLTANVPPTVMVALVGAAVSVKSITLTVTEVL